MRKVYTGIRTVNNKYKKVDISTELTTSSISLEHNKQTKQNISNVLGYNNQSHQYGQHEYMGDPNMMDSNMMNPNMMNSNMMDPNMIDPNMMNYNMMNSNMNQMYPSNINYLNNPINNIPQMYPSNINPMMNPGEHQISNIQSMPMTSLEPPKTTNNTNIFTEQNNVLANKQYTNIENYNNDVQIPSNQTGGKTQVFYLNNLSKLIKKS